MKILITVCMQFANACKQNLNLWAECVHYGNKKLHANCACFACIQYNNNGIQLSGFLYCLHATC